jgi:CHAT domain-containing protein
MVAVLADPVFDRSDERVKGGRSNGPSTQQAAGVEKRGVADTVIESKLTRSVKDLGSDDEGSLFPLPRLPFTRREAEAVVALTPAEQSEKALDFAANRAAATDPGLSQYRYVHFATHVIVDAVHPELSGLVLSLVDKDGKDLDGFLQAHEVYNLNLPAELIVLSACRTGLGKEVKGEGLLSLTRGFMYAGGARVLVSLWDVNDQSTAELMTQLYKEMLGKGHLSPAAALRQAQLLMWRSTRWQAPYYWAAFVLHGEYK